MSDVTMRDLRNRGGEIIDRVEAGEEITITRNGRPVAELRSIRKPQIDAETLVERWSKLVPMDPAALRADLDAIIDPSL